MAFRIWVSTQFSLACFSLKTWTSWSSSKLWSHAARSAHSTETGLRLQRFRVWGLLSLGVTVAVVFRVSGSGFTTLRFRLDVFGV